MSVDAGVLSVGNDVSMEVVLLVVELKVESAEVEVVVTIGAWIEVTTA